jgi:hypothetical protein
MRRRLHAAERRAAALVAVGTLAATLSGSPRVYEAWAKRTGAELARLRLVGSLAGLVGVLRFLENGTWRGGDRLLEMGDALRGLLHRLVAWEGATEVLPAAVVVAAQGCLSTLQPSLLPRGGFSPVSDRVTDSQSVSPNALPSTPDDSLREVSSLLEQLRQRYLAQAVLVLDRQGQLLANSTLDEATSESAEEGALPAGVVYLSPDIAKALPRIDWSHRFALEDGREVLVGSLGEEAVLVAMGDAETCWTGFMDSDTRSALVFALRRLLEPWETVETQRVPGPFSDDPAAPFR